MNGDLQPPRQSACIDLVIPARNEEACLPALFSVLASCLPPAALRHVVVADNGSTDRTPRIAAAHGATVVREPQPGYGAACLAALDWIGQQAQPPDIVAFLDADLSDDPEGLSALLQHMKASGADLVIGSRPRRAEPGALTLPQRVGNLLACRIIQGVTGVRFTDLGPLRAVRWSALRRLAMTDTTWGWTVEMQFKAALHGLRCEEIDVAYRRRHAGRSKISGSIVGSCRAGTKILTTLGAIWWKWRKRPAGATSP